MTMILSSLDRIRRLVRTGDVFAYGADRGLGEWIEAFTDSDQSHTSFAVVQGDLLQVTEATIRGAKTRPVAKNWEKAADMWWLPIGRRLRFDGDALMAYLQDICQRRVRYDFRALSPRVWRRGRPPEDFRRLYCSELVALGLKKAGVYEGTAELTPADVCRLAVYEGSYHCIKWGDDGPKKIDDYNTVTPYGDPLGATVPAF